MLHVEGPHRYSASDFAAGFATALGRQVEAQAVARDQWERSLANGGLGASYARLLCELQDAHNAGWIDVEPGGEVRRGTTTLANALTR